ncbi:hypothetical protein SASC598P14_006630, partial [Snodgrassella alvi SCGC AB-598-P14]
MKGMFMSQFLLVPTGTQTNITA